MKLRALSILTAAVLILALFSSCKNNTSPSEEAESDYISDSNLELAQTVLDKAPDSLAAYKNILFTLSDKSITRLDLLSKEKTVLINDSPAIAIGCNGSCIATVSESKVSLYDYDGNLLSEAELDSGISGTSAAAVKDGAVIFNAAGEKGDVLYLWNTDSGEVSLLPDSWKPGIKDASVSSITVLSNGEALINYSFNHSWSGWNVMLIRYDFLHDSIISSNTYDEDFDLSYGCFDTNGDLYYVSKSYADISDAVCFISMQSEDGTSGNVFYLDSKKLTKMSSNDNIRAIYTDGSNHVLFDSDSNTVITAGVDDELAPIIILGLESGEFSDIIPLFTAETGRQVKTINYPEEEYNDRLRTKLLANESDFDLFIADDTVLRSILENSAFEPLDGCENVVSNFDNVLASGVRGMMTYKDSLFGVPLYAGFCTSFMFAEEYDLLKDWTVSDMFDAADGLPEGKKLFIDRYLLTPVTQNYIQDMISKDGAIDKEELTAFYEKLKSYNDRGILCDGDAEYILTYGGTQLHPNSLAYAYNSTGAEDSKNIKAPTRSGITYIDIFDTMLMNRSSENKDAAAEFLDILTSEKSVYNNRNFNIFIGKDIGKNSYYKQLDSSAADVLEFSMTLYENSKLSTVDGVEGLPEFISEQTLFPVLDGEITPDEAAQKIIDEVAYTYFE